MVNSTATYHPLRSFVFSFGIMIRKNEISFSGDSLGVLSGNNYMNTCVYITRVHIIGGRLQMATDLFVKARKGKMFQDIWNKLGRKLILTNGNSPSLARH